MFAFKFCLNFGPKNIFEKDLAKEIRVVKSKQAS